MRSESELLPIKIKRSTWKWLMATKLEKGYSSVDEVIQHECDLPCTKKK